MVESFSSVNVSIRLLEEVKLVIPIVVVKEVHTRHLLAHELGKVSLVAAVVTFEPVAKF